MKTKITAHLAVWICFALFFGNANAQDNKKKESVTKDSLKKDPTKLKEVTISGKKAAIQFKLDRTVVNVAAMISAAGANALEVLERAPGVIIGQNGEVSYQGKSGVTILIDGKPTYLSGDNLAGYLRSLPAGSLEEIELMSNPPAKYEASGTGGIINIRTKKHKGTGFNGTLSVSIAKTDYWRNNESLSLNYYTNKVNLYANLGYSFSKTNKTLDLERSYFDADGALSSRYVQKAYFRPNNQYSNGKLGLDYSITPKTTLGLLLSGSLAPGRYQSPVNTQLFGSSGTVDSLITANNTAKSKFSNGGLTLSMLTKLDSTRQLSFDADFLAYNAANRQSFINQTYLPGEDLQNTETTLTDLPSNIKIYSAKSDYSQPLKNKAKLELGVKSSYVNADNLAAYFMVVNGKGETDNSRTNSFSYKENINAGYLNFSKQMHRLSFQLGLRLENTNLKGLQSGNSLRPDSAFSQHYLNLFPTAYLSFKLDSAGGQQLNFSYGRRIDRPYYKDLNPFIYIIDKYTYSAGNPLLGPQTTTNYELSWRYRSMLSVTGVYNHYRNFQTETVAQTGGIFISTPSNIGKKTTLGINSSLNWKPAKWWDSNFYTELVNLKFGGQIMGKTLNTSTTYYYFETGNQFTIANGLSAELSAFYISGRTIGQFELDGKSQVSAGLQKKLMKNKGAVKISVTDLFRDNLSSGRITNVAGAAAVYRNDFDSSMLSLGFSYNFGGSKGSEQKKKSAGSAQSEQGRIKN